jgi:hypothetical protein
MVAFKVKDPSTGVWLPVPTVGPIGPSGPTGPTGPTGPVGPAVVVGTTYTVTYEPNVSGAMDFRVNDAMVTMRMTNVKRSVAETGASATAFKVCNYPAGVPPPWEALFIHNIDLCSDDVFTPVARRVMVQVGTDAVWVKLYAGAAEVDYNANDRITCTASWAL